MSDFEVERLNEAYAVDGLGFETGEGGLPRGVVRTDACEGAFYLHGAQVTRWRPTGHDDVLWLSPLATYEDGRALRGGVPICFPWFGAHPDRPDAPSHGVARLRAWDVVETRSHDGTVEVALETQIEAWTCRLTATFGEALTLDLEVRNDGDAPASFEAALHTYLAVSDIRAVAVDGFEDAPFIDMAAGGRECVAEGAPIRFVGEVDRLYPGGTAPVTVRDAGRLIEITGEGARSTIVWNPGAARASALADLGEWWARMLCVETANVREARVTLRGGQAHLMRTTIRTSSLGPTA